MMKSTLTLLFTLLLSCNGWAQSGIQTLKTTLFRIPVEVVGNEQLTLRQVEGKAQTDKRSKLAELIALELNDGDLLLNYRLQDQQEADFFYDIQFSVQNEEGTVLHLPFADLTGDFGIVQALKKSDYQLTWTDATENGLEYGGKYTVILAIALRGDPGVDCSQPRPSFGMEKQWPHYLGALAGVGLVAVGQAFKNQANTDYSNYLQAWENGESGSSANNLLEEANNKDKTYEALTYAGIAVITVDAAWMIYRIIQTKSEQKKYDLYCGGGPPGLGFSPKIDFGQVTATPSVGLKMTWRF